MTDTTTALLILHEREIQLIPQTKQQVKLVEMLATAAVLSADRDRTDKPNSPKTKKKK